MDDPRWHIVMGQHQQLRPGEHYHWDNAPRQGDGLILKLVQRGSLPVIIEGQAAQVAAGEAWHFRHGETSSYGFRQGAPEGLELSWISLAGAGLQEHWNWLSQRRGRQPGCAMEGAWMNALNALIDAHLADPHRRDQGPQLLQLIMAYAQAQSSNRQQRLSPLQRALLRLREEPLGVSDISGLARAAGVSREHLSRSFQLAYGEAPARWLMRSRLEHARRLLLIGAQSVAEIAHLCGFSSAAVLARALRQHYGKGPRALREG
ncbi:MAG: AraC family transcriptional regulator [Planctomycetota bacterium]|nr:MAG: AraC family transcriptional regulator [Planctomycetota bacterium]